MDQTNVSLCVAARQGAKQAGVCWCFLVLLILITRSSLILQNKKHD